MEIDKNYEHIKKKIKICINTFHVLLWFLMFIFYFY